MSSMKSPVNHLLAWRQQSFPVDWQTEFRRDAPLHLEVGFGDGRFTVRRAKALPEEDFVGLEISSASLQRGWKNLRRNEIDNVRMIKVQAQFAVQHLFPEDSISSIVVNFPDPWPKEKHEKNRLLQDSFFKLAASRLKAGGSINLATDHPDYLAFAQEESQKSGLFSMEEAEPPEAVFETKYALKWKTQGKPLFYQVFRYEGAEAPQYSVLERPVTMPHALLTGDLPDSTEFSKQVHKYADGHVILHEALDSFGSDDPDESREKWLVRTTIDEPGLKQQILVAIKKRSGNELIVRLEPFGDPIITKTTRGAVHAVAEWLVTLPTNLRIVERNY